MLVSSSVTCHLVPLYTGYFSIDVSNTKTKATYRRVYDSEGIKRVQHFGEVWQAGGGSRKLEAHGRGGTWEMAHNFNRLTSHLPQQ